MVRLGWTNLEGQMADKIEISGSHSAIVPCQYEGCQHMSQLRTILILDNRSFQFIWACPDEHIQSYNIYGFGDKDLITY